MPTVVYNKDVQVCGHMVIGTDGTDIATPFGLNYLINIACFSLMYSPYFICFN